MNELTRACLKAIYEKRWVLLIVAVVAFGFSLLRVLFLTAGSYYAETILVVSTPKQGAEVKELVPTPLNPKIYAELVNSRTVLYETWQAVQEQQVMPEDKLPEFDDFASLLRASVSVVDQTTRPINYSPIITMRAWSTKPEYARQIVDIWAQKAMKMAQNANLMQYGQLALALEKQAEIRKTDLDEVWQDLEKEKAEFDVASKREELRLLLQETNDLQHALSVTERQMAAAEARLNTVREKLATEEPVIELFRSPSDDAYWLLEKGPKEVAKKPSVEGKGMVTQQLNEVYWKLKEDENQAASGLAAAQAEVEKIQAQIDDITKRRLGLQAEIAQHELAQQRLSVDEDLAATIYKSVSTAQTFLAESAKVVEGGGESAVYPVGLNRLSNLSPVKDDLALKSKIIVLVYTFLTVALAMAVITAPIIREKLLEQMNK